MSRCRHVTTRVGHRRGWGTNSEPHRGMAERIRSDARESSQRHCSLDGDRCDRFVDSISAARRSVQWSALWGPSVAPMVRFHARGGCAANVPAYIAHYYCYVAWRVRVVRREAFGCQMLD